MPKKKRSYLHKTAIYNRLAEAGETLLPLGGGWVCVVGNPLAPRGLRLPNFGLGFDIRHMDIFWAFDEECPWNFPQKGILDIPAADVLDGHELADYICDLNRISSLQLTWMKVVTSYSDTVRFWQGEVRLLSDDLIDDLLQENLVETISFAGKSHPILEEAIRDIVDALQMDGLSFQAAQAEAIRCGVLEPSQLVHPNWFYRPIGAFREMFVEE